jgi:hypothetical protein
MRARASARELERVVQSSLIFGRILFKFPRHILQMTTSHMSYIHIIFNHRAHACEHARANARVIKRSLIHGRILFTFSVNRLQITTSSMGYILIMFTHRAHACGGACAGARVRAHAWLRARLSLDRFLSNLLWTDYKSTQVAWYTYFSWRVFDCMS